MASYTLYYFNGRGRAAICRMLFAAAGVQYADKRIEFKDWDYFKSSFYVKNNVDMTRIDYICNSFYNIMDDYLRLYQDKDGCIMFDKFADIRQRYKDIDRITGSDMHQDSWSGDRLSKAMMMEMLWRYQETCRRVLPFLEGMLKTYSNGNFYFMGDRMTIADMMCYVALENPLYENPNLLDGYSKLAALRTRIATHQKILPYIKKRPKTEF